MSAGLREELECAICLDLYNNPILLKCGHIFCWDCIVAHLYKQEESGIYSCPECRQQYTERPLLNKNRWLTNIVDRFRAACQEETIVFCTYCDFRVPASKSCLHCEASFCDEHLQCHSKSVHHILTEPTTDFEDRICSAHQKLLKFYCTKDCVCICMSCWVDGDHKGHDLELLNEASEKMKEKLRESSNKLNAERQKTEGRIQDLRERRTEEKISVLYGRVTELFKDLRKRLKDVEENVLIELLRQEEQISQSVSDLIQQLELQKDMLTMKIDQIKEMCNIRDPLMVLKKGPNRDYTSETINIGNAACLDEGIISLMLHRGLNFTDNLIDLQITRPFSVMEKSDIFLDLNTADNNIIISDDLKVASYSDVGQDRPEGPERFKSKQVLSINSFTSGKHYWEVDVSGSVEQWLIGVAAHSIERKIEGNESYIGANDKSWGVQFRESLGAQHNRIFERLNSNSPVRSVGIYLDYEMGRLSFFQMCDPIRHLHTFTATFTEPLHAAFYVFEKSSIRVLT